MKAEGRKVNIGEAIKILKGGNDPKGGFSAVELDAEKVGTLVRSLEEYGKYLKKYDDAKKFMGAMNNCEDLGQIGECREKKLVPIQSFYKSSYEWVMQSSRPNSSNISFWEKADNMIRDMQRTSRQDSEVAG